MNPLPILQHLETNRILPTDVLLLRIHPNIQVIRNQIIVRAILPVSPAQQIQPRRRRLRIINFRRSRRGRAHLLLRSVSRSSQQSSTTSHNPQRNQTKPQKPSRRNPHEPSPKTEPLYTLLRRTQYGHGTAVSLHRKKLSFRAKPGICFFAALPQTKKRAPTSMPSSRFPISIFQFPSSVPSESSSPTSH